jgi:hypothetical protein
MKNLPEKKNENQYYDWFLSQPLTNMIWDEVPGKVL